MADQNLELDSKERVAFNLMERISLREANSKTDTVAQGFEKPDPRTYYLTLIHQCMKAVIAGYDITDILRKD